MWRERQTKLRAFQRLALALFVAAKHERVGGWIEIEPDNVPEFCLKIPIVGELEGLDDVRFEFALRPDPLHCAMGDAYVATHAAHAPAVAVLGRVRDFSDDTLDLICWNPRLPTASRFVFEAVETEFPETTRPLRYGRHRRADPLVL